MLYKNIETSKIIVDKRIRISFKREEGDISNSIKKYGLKNPLIVQNLKGKFVLLAGFKRYDSLKELEITHAVCQIIKKPLTDCEKIVLNIDDNLATRELSLYEKINALNKLKKYRCEQFLKYISLLKISPNLIEETDITLFPHKLLKLLDNGDFDKKTLSYLKYFKKEHLSLLADYFYKFQFTKSEKRKFIDNLLRAEEMNTDILKFLWKNIDYEKEEIINNLYKITNPQTERLEKKLSILKKELKGIKLLATPYFENPSLRLEIQFKDFEQLKKTLNRLLKQIEEKTGVWYED